MKRCARTFLLGVVLFGCAVAPAVRAQEQTGPVESDAAAWKKFAPEGGGFTVLMPGTVSEEKQPIESEAMKIENRLYSVETKLGVYMITYADFPEVITDAALIQRMLDGGRDKALSNTKGKMVSETNIKLDGYAGREWLVEIPGGTVVPGGIVARARAYWVKRRLFQILVLREEEPNATPERVRIREGATMKFLDSFALTGATAAN